MADVTVDEPASGDWQPEHPLSARGLTIMATAAAQAFIFESFRDNETPDDLHELNNALGNLIREASELRYRLGRQIERSAE